MTARTLAQIRDELLGLADSGDPEGAHSKADDLLLETITKLAGAAGHAVVGREIVAAFDEVPRWYA